MSQNPELISNFGFSDRLARTIHLFLATSICLAAAFKHRYLESIHDLKGPTALLDHALDFWIALGISALLLSVGYAAGKILSLEYRNAAEKICFSLFIGTGLSGLSILFLALLGFLNPSAVIALLGTYAILSTRDVPEVYASITRAVQSALSTRESLILSCLFLSLLALLALRAATPPHIPDELIYHLPVPLEFVQQGRVFPSFDNSLGNVPFLIHMLYAVCLLAGSDIAAKLISLMLALSCAIAIYAFCIRFLNRRIARVAIFAFFAAGVVVELAVTVRIDASLAGMLFASTYAMINYLTSQRQGWLWTSAVLAGFSLGIKHTAAVWLIFVGVMYLVEAIRKGQPILRVLQLGVVYVFLSLLIASPWYIKNAIWFHNPLYPFITGEVASVGKNGSRYFDAEDERKLDAHFEDARNRRPDLIAGQQKELMKIVKSRTARHPVRLWELFFRPNAYLMAEPYQFPNYLFLVIPLIVFLKPDKWVLWLLALSLAFIFSVTLTSWIARYLLPAYPALTIVAAYTLTSTALRLRHRFPLLKKLPEYAVLAALASVVATSVASMRYFNSPAFVAGKISRHDFLLSLPDYRPIDFMNRQLPSKARVMAIGAQMTYGLNRDYIADESWFATKWRRVLVHNESLEQVNQELKNQGVTHIFYNPTLFKFAARMGVNGTGGMNLIAQVDDPASPESRELGPEYSILRNWSTFTVYKDQFLEPIYSDDHGYQVLRIK